MWIVDAHRDDGRRFVVRADEKLNAFMELDSATGCVSGSRLSGRDLCSQNEAELLKQQRGFCLNRTESCDD